MNELWDHQKKAIELAKRVPDLALFFDVGTGKSRTTIEILRYHYNTHKRILKTIIFAPVIVVDNWRIEFAKFSKIPESKIHCLHGPLKKRAEFLLSNQGIFVTNYDALISDDFFKAVLAYKPEILVCDESHRLKGYTAKRTKKMIRISVEMEDRKKLGAPVHRYLLTGTPILNSQMDVFSQFNVLDGGSTFGTNYFAFRASYFYDKNAGMPKYKHFPNWQPIPARQPELSIKVGAKSIQAKKEECLDLPPLIRQEIFTEMSSEQRKAYDELKKDFITFVEGDACVAQLALTKALRMQQCLSGFLKMDSGDIHTFEENPRIEALKELLSDIAPYHKVIVWSVFKENYKHIARACAELKLGFVEVTGDTPSQEKSKNVDKFRFDDSVRVYISNPQASGLGINLVESSYTIFYNRNFSLEADIQAEARNYRAGSERHDKVTRIDIVCKNSLDELILTSLKEKQDLAAKILSLKNRL